MNLLQPEAQMETGEVSEKIKRGRHTTRHSELIRIEKDTYVLDTPGFSSLFIHMFEEDEIKDYFQEFAPYEDECRFQPMKASQAGRDPMPGMCQWKKERSQRSVMIIM